VLQELGYKKQLKYYGTQVTYEGFEPVWHVQVYIFTPKPLRGVFEVEKIHAAIAQDATSMLEYVMLCHTQFLCQNQVLTVCMTQNQLFHIYDQKCSQITTCHE
jgi:hypothetical protein